MLKVSFREAKETDVRRYAAQLERSDYAEWSKHDFVGRLLNELALKAGIKKAVNPHAFRHSRATFMAKHLKELK